jgi:hypothetical protein
MPLPNDCHVRIRGDKHEWLASASGFTSRGAATVRRGPQPPICWLGVCGHRCSARLVGLARHPAATTERAALRGGRAPGGSGRAHRRSQRRLRHRHDGGSRLTRSGKVDRQSLTRVAGFSPLAPEQLHGIGCPLATAPRACQRELSRAARVTARRGAGLRRAVSRDLERRPAVRALGGMRPRGGCVSGHGAAIATNVRHGNGTSQQANSVARVNSVSRAARAEPELVAISRILGAWEDGADPGGPKKTHT